MYPTPEEPGTERSFEEIIAAHRGWLDSSWEDDIVDQALVPDYSQDLENKSWSEDNLPVQRDVPLQDENGESYHEPRPHKKKKLMDENKTQISMHPRKPMIT